MNNFLLKIKNSDAYFDFKRDKIAVVCFIILFLFVLFAFLAPLIAPFNPYDLASLDILDSEIPPVFSDGGDSIFLLGTDDQGRDILSTILYGMRTSILIGFFAVLLQICIGIFIGLISGYFGSWLDSLLMRFADIQLSLSTLMVAIIISAIFKSSFGLEFYSDYALISLIFIIGISEWPPYARTVRAMVKSEKDKEYVEAARVMKFSNFRILFHHILPNCLSPVVVISTLQFANAIMSEAALSFLGLGMPVSQPSLGALIKTGYEYVFSGSWWMLFFPGMALVILVFTSNLLGDWLRDYFNPKNNKNI